MENTISVVQKNFQTNQILYREIRKLPVPYYKKLPRKGIFDYDVGQEIDETINYNLDNVITAYVLKMVPNTNLYMMEENCDLGTMTSWVKLCKLYMAAINNLFQERCQAEMKKIESYRNRQALTKKLDLKYIDKLPIELVKTIYEYLPYETQIDVLLNKYPNWKENLLKTRKANELKVYYDWLYKNYMNEYYITRGLYQNGQLKLRSWDFISYLNVEYWMSRKRGIYRKSDVTAYLDSYIKKYSNLKNPADKRERIIYNVLAKQGYAYIKNIMYVATRMSKKIKLRSDY